MIGFAIAVAFVALIIACGALWLSVNIGKMLLDVQDAHARAAGRVDAESFVTGRR